MKKKIILSLVICLFSTAIYADAGSDTLTLVCPGSSPESGVTLNYEYAIPQEQLGDYTINAGVHEYLDGKLRLTAQLVYPYRLFGFMPIPFSDPYRYGIICEYTVQFSCNGDNVSDIIISPKPFDPTYTAGNTGDNQGQANQYLVHDQGHSFNCKLNGNEHLILDDVSSISFAMVLEPT